MVITSRLLPLKKQAAYSDYLVNFQRAQPSKSGQFSVRGNRLALCGRHQVMKKNYWDSSSGKINVVGILQSVNRAQKKNALDFLLQYFGAELKSPPKR